MAVDFCLVVMGFGKKVDFDSGKQLARTLDLDKTYEAIIEPAVTAAGLKCIRSDMISQSGVIDQKMYEMLLRAELVVADISTANANAIYELGVRHALRPYSTIVIKEQDGQFYFDLNHIATLQYKHLGEDIGHSEAKVKRAALEALIREVTHKRETDSPVYTYLKSLRQPMMTEEELQEAVQTAAIESECGIAAAILAGRAASNSSHHAKARDEFQRAYDLQNARGAPAAVDPYIVQQLALHTYKAKQPSAFEALKQAREVIERLSPETSTDPETLGIAGAICKRMAAADPSGGGHHLDTAIEYYGRGFAVKNDYYNGENYALCLDLRSAQQTDKVEAGYDCMTARKARERVRRSLKQAFADSSCKERPDYLWMLATASHIEYALGDATAGEAFERAFRDQAPPKWAIETFDDGRSYALNLARKS